MTNYDKWNSYMSGVSSPQSYIDFGFYYLIAASLQRRVWTGPDQKRLYPNQYVTLVGEPGLGKGLVIEPVSYMLRYHKLEINGQQKTTVDNSLDHALAESNYERATKIKSPEKPLLFPVAADATTYEALVTALARATRGISYKVYDDTLQKFTSKAYLHCSLAFCLEEISSLFRRKTEDTVNLLIKMYDCGDYEKETKTQGIDFVKQGCLNFLGGTTPSFMEATFNDHLLNDGYSSRCWFIYESANRFNTLTIPTLTEEQKQYRVDLLAHIKKLSYLYGHIDFEQDAWNWLENWYKNIHPKTRPNTSPKLIPYYARKNIHVQKMAIAVHCAEDAEMNEDKSPKNKIKLASCQRAMHLLDDAELRAHYALSFNGNNPLAVVSKKMIKFLRANGPQTGRDLHTQVWDDVRGHEFNEIIDYLTRNRTIELTEENNVKRWKLT